MRFVTRFGVARRGRCAGMARGLDRRRNARRHRDRNQDRPDHALQRPGLGVRRARQGRGRLFQDAQRARRHQRPQDQSDLARRQLRAAEDRGADAAAGGERRGRADLLLDRHRPQHRDRQISAEQEHPAIVHRLRRLEIRRHRAISAGDAGRAGAVPLRGAALRALCAGEESERQIRRDFAERRFRPRLSAGPEGRARREIRFARHRRDLRNPGSDHRLPDRQAEGLRRRRVRDRGDAEIRRAVDPQGLRDRLAADDVPVQRRGLGVHGDGARRARGRHRHSRPPPMSRTPTIPPGRTMPASRAGANS